MRHVQVPLGERSYRIQIGQDLIRSIGACCRRMKLGRRSVVITDDRVGPLYSERVVASLEASGFEVSCLSLPAGERSKCLKSVQLCYDHLSAMRLERQSFIVALGGGVVGDLAGFVAATYLRGIDFIQIPTTLLSQVDSSVGGKVGINLPRGKNLVGAFYQPRWVLCDLDTLNTLPEREYRSGLAEVMKYGVIYDPKLFRLLERRLKSIEERDPALMEQIVASCCRIKAAVVAEDEREGGLRAILNFGHTIGHAIEAITRYGTYLHGEAISVGQVAAARLSRELLGMNASDAERVEGLLAAFGLPTSIALNKDQRRRLEDAMRLDKKVLAGEVKFVLARSLGHVEPGHAVPEEQLRAVLDGLAPC